MKYFQVKNCMQSVDFDLGEQLIPLSLVCSYVHGPLPKWKLETEFTYNKLEDRPGES